MLRICVKDRDYASFVVVDANEGTDVDVDIDPVRERLFDGDEFDLDDGKALLRRSPARESGPLPGVLVLDGSRTYGKLKDKFLYRCIPDDRRIPDFVVPYAHKAPGFVKKQTDRYVTFEFVEWSGKHPSGVLRSNIGAVDETVAFYEYQLHCRGLSVSLGAFTRATSRALGRGTHGGLIADIIAKNAHFEDRRNTRVISVDPQGSRDFDDAFGFRREGDDSVVSIYIANVSVWLETLGLWDEFAERTSTIYLPDRKRPMLPSVLSDQLCSLMQGETRFALTVDVVVRAGKMASWSFHNTIVNVARNYVYEDPCLGEDACYVDTLATVKPLAQGYVDEVHDSHDLVACLMVIANCLCARRMLEDKVGIYRSVALRATPEIPVSLPPGVRNFVRVLGSSAGRYTHYRTDMRHEMMDLDSYVHITSPIRRLVDLLNSVSLQRLVGIMTFGSDCTAFCERWGGRLERINEASQASRRVQADCELLHACENNPAVLGGTHDGCVIDSTRRHDGMVRHTVYLSRMKMLGIVTLGKALPEFAMGQFKVYLFADSAGLRRKIRLEVVSLDTPI